MQSQALPGPYSNRFCPNVSGPIVRLYPATKLHNHAILVAVGVIGMKSQVCKLEGQKIETWPLSTEDIYTTMLFQRLLDKFVGKIL